MQAFSAVSMEKDSFKAGKEAAERITRHLPDGADILWAFGASTHDQQKLLDGIHAVWSDVPLIGCTTDGEISSSGLSEESVVILALASDTVKFHIARAPFISQNSYLAGTIIGDAFKNLNCRYIQIFSDGITGNATEIVAGIQAILGKQIKIAGGTSGDKGLFIHTSQYYNNQVLTDSIVAVAFAGDISFGTGYGCGWIPVGIPKQVTRSEGNALYELDGQPALQVYEKFLGKYASQLPAVGVEYPLGILGLDEENEEEGFLCRATMGVNRRENSILFGGDVPQGAHVKMTMGNEKDLIDAARRAAQDALADLKGVSGKIEPKLLFVFSCMARKIVLGSRTEEELSEIRKIVGYDVPVIGFYTYGEYSPSGKSRQTCFHNETVTLTVIGQ